MLIVAGEIEIDPGKREAAEAAVRKVMEATRREPGCRAYVFSAHLARPGVFQLFEEWESQDALDAHFKMPHMAEFMGAMGGLGVKRMEVAKYQVTSKGPLR